MSPERQALQAELLALSDELGCIGLQWLTDDWSDTAAPKGLQLHDGGTTGSNSIVIFSPDLDAGIVLLSNHFVDAETGFMPSMVAMRAVDAWWCGAAEGEC